MNLTDGKKLRVYKFDWDNNILNLPTKIKMYRNGNPVFVSTEDFAVLRNNPEYEIRGDAFEDFRDYGNRGANGFIEDTKKAITDNNTAPSFKKFKEAIIYVNYFAIITARGHSPNTIKNGVKTFIQMALSPTEKIFFKKNLKKVYGDLPYSDLINKYLDEQKYYPVSSPEFIEKFGSHGGADKPEIAKQIASIDFIDYIESEVKKLNLKGVKTIKTKNPNDIKISVGFSDDDKKNVSSMIELMTKIKKEKPNLNLVVYDTSNPDKIKKIVIEQKIVNTKTTSNYKSIPDIHKLIQNIIADSGLVYDDYYERFVKYDNPDNGNYNGYYEICVELSNERYGGGMDYVQYLRLSEKIKRLVGVNNVEIKNRKIIISMINEYPDMYL